MQPNLVKCLPKGNPRVQALYTAEAKQICSEIGTCYVVFQGLDSDGTLLSIVKQNKQRGNERRMGVVLLFQQENCKGSCSLRSSRRTSTAKDTTCVTCHVLGESLHRRQVRSQNDAVQVVVVLCNSGILGFQADVTKKNRKEGPRPSLPVGIKTQVLALAPPLLNSHLEYLRMVC